LTLSDFLQEFLEYSTTADYRRGVYVEVSGFTIDLLLLSLLVPIFVWLLNLRKSNRTKSMASFYTLQFLREAINLLLRLGGVANANTELRAALKRGKIESLSSHAIYGNTEDLLTLLGMRLRNGDHMAGYRSLDSAAIRDLVQRSQEILNKLDQYIFLFNAVGLTEFSKKFFDARVLFYPLRDYAESLAKEDTKKSIQNDDVIGLSTTVYEFTKQWFMSEKRRPDTIYRWRSRLSIIRLLAKLPYILVYRITMPTLHRMRGIPHLDPSGTNFFSIMLRLIAGGSSLTQEEIASHLHLSHRRFNEYRLGYKRPPNKEQETLLLSARELLPPASWNSFVLRAIQMDVGNQRPTVATIEAVKATAIYWFCQLIVKDQSSDDLSEVFWTLFQMKPVG